MNNSSQSGFTLIELIIAIAIIAILTTIGVVVYVNAQKSGRDVKRKADIAAISTALEAHHSDQTNTYECLKSSWFTSGNSGLIDPNRAYALDPIGYYEFPGCDASNNFIPPQTATSWIACAHLETSTGNASDAAGNPQPNGDYYCQRNQQ